MSVLDEIIVGVREDLAARVAATPIEAIRERAQAASPALDPRPALRAPGVSVIAEVKRSSPSKGRLAQIADPAQLARSYADGGAAAISVLTEARRFHGSLDDFDAVRAQVATPLLRKDFMVDEYQFFEARAHGADLVLLIVAALDDAQLTDFHALSLELGMTPLVETHTPDEVERALAIGAEVIGVNNRNLKTLDVDLGAFARLVEHIPAGRIRVAESGITDAADVELLAAAGADAVLVGEALVKHGRPSEAVAEFAHVGR